MTRGDGIVARRLSLGQLVITRAAVGRLTPKEIAEGIAWHVRGAWGDISPDNAAEKELSLREGFRLFSAYGRGDRRSWVITESDRSGTTVLMPDDYERNAHEAAIRTDPRATGSRRPPDPRHPLAGPGYRRS
jgi:hypothetical protein